MPRQALLFAAAFGLLLAVSPAYGQTLRIDVPFDFVVNHTVLPAGQYLIDVDPSRAQRLSIASTHEGKRVFVFVRDAAFNSPPPPNKVVFRQEGDRYVLHQVWAEGRDHFHDICHGEDVPELE
jgi:hypothetical protein